MTSSNASSESLNHQRQLQGQRARLERELAAAFNVRPLSGDLIERLVLDLAAVDRALATDGLATAD